MKIIRIFSFLLLLGAVVSSTDAAAVFAILRSKSVSLQGRLQPLLELESGSNDPMAAFLTVFMIGIIQNPETSYWSIFPAFFGKMSIGIVWGYLVGRAGAWLYTKLKLDYEGLYFVLGISLVLFAYGIAECIYGNGFMACYVCGLTMGNLRFNYKKGLVRFSDGVGWLMQVMLFLVLGLLVFPKQLPGIAISGFILALLLMFVARPAAVLLCMIRSPYSMRERLLISWVGLRGAAPIVFATFPLLAGIENAGLLFNLVFFIVIASVLIQGRTLMPFARLLKLDKPLNDKVRAPIELEETDTLNSKMFEFEIPPDAPFVNKTLAEMKLPPGVLVLLLLWGRGDAFTLSILGENGLSLNLYTILFIAFFGIGYGAYYATADMPIPMVADCSDYETYISGKYIPGIMGTLFSLVDKLVSSLSATVVGVAVSFIGLDSLPTQYDPYTPGMNVVVIVLFCVIPMIAWAATLLAMKNYSLTGEKMKEIQAVNACRRDAVAGGMSLEDAMQKWQTIDQLPAQYRAN